MKTIITVIFLVFVIIIGMTAIEKDRASFYNQLNGNANVTTEQSNATNNTPKKVSVILTGEIKNPGEYQVEENTLLKDVVDLAGGKTAMADTDCFNFNLLIDEDIEIYIATLSDKEKISINKATFEEITTLDGIGKVLGTRIIEYRENNGAFMYLEQIMNVDGVGKKIFDSIKTNICL